MLRKPAPDDKVVLLPLARALSKPERDVATGYRLIANGSNRVGWHWKLRNSAIERLVKMRSIPDKV